MSEHSADCCGTDHKNAHSHFVCRAFDGHSFQPLVEASKAESETTILTSQSGRKVQMSRAARTVLRSKGCNETVASPIVIRSNKQDSTEGNGYDDVVFDVLVYSVYSHMVTCQCSGRALYL